MLIRENLFMTFIIFSSFFLFSLSPADASAGGNELKLANYETYITINHSPLQLRSVFEQIEKQTSLSFVFDENDVNLLQEVAIPTGKYPLEELLRKISARTNLEFTENKEIILVKPSSHLIVNIEEADDFIQIKGKITDETGNALPGVTVTVKGSLTATQTNGEGEYMINADEGEILVFTSIGFETVERTVGTQTQIDVVLALANQQLNEVVVVGYQTQRRGDLSGAVSVINTDDVAKLPDLSVDQALQGKAPGVRITQNTGQPGDGVAVRIRGVGTINDNNPLFVIDGVPTKDGINFLSADDIQSMVVLKDASSAAIYGSRAANGVIVITTKSGKNGKAEINYNGYAGFQTHGKLPEMANAQEYVTMYNEAADNDNAGVTNPALIRPKIPDGLVTNNTDWLKAIFQKGIIQNHQLSVRGGNDKILYYLSGNYFRQEGIILNSWYERYSLLSKLDITPFKNLKIGSKINLSYSKKNMIGSSGDGYGGNGGSVVRYAFFRTPPIPVYDADGNFTDLPDFPAFFGDGYNPVALAEKADNKETEYRVFSDLYAQYKILKNLTFKTDLGADAIITDSKRFDENFGTNLRINNPSKLTVGALNNLNLIWNNTLTYNAVLGGGNFVNVLVGTEAIANKIHLREGTDRGFADQSPNFRYIGNGNGMVGSTIATENQSESSLFSVFGSVNYIYKDLYLLSGNVRRDGSSRFGPDNKYGTFFSGSAGWNIHNTDFIRDKVPAISHMKLRASYGQLGNQEIPNYAYFSILGDKYNYPFGVTPASVPGYTIASRGNPGIKWESSTQADAGLDIGILENAVSLSVDYYIKTTSDMLIPVPLPLIGGSATSPFLNAGKIRNQGLEVQLELNSSIDKLKYSLTANFSTLKNRVLSLSDGQSIASGRIDNNYNATLTTVGHPIGSFFLYEQEGIFQDEADVFAHAYQGKGITPGDVKFKDQNEDGVIDENDRVFLGSAIPKYIYGATAGFEYGNFDLSIFFQGQYGNKIYSQVNMDIEGFYRPFNMTKRAFDQRWQGKGTSDFMPKPSFKDGANNKFPSSRFLENGSYLRLKNIQLGYTLPQSILKRLNIKNLRVYVTSQNLFTITNYTGLDPEMTISDNVKRDTFGGDLAAGIDWGTYPSARSYIVGLNLNF